VVSSAAVPAISAADQLNSEPPSVTVLERQTAWWSADAPAPNMKSGDAMNLLRSDCGPAMAKRASRLSST
jgi:hypothetical protein